MIVDSHAYCFESLALPAGHASAKEHLHWAQAAHARHHQPAWRVRDRAPAASDVLDPEARFDFGRLPDVAFRVDRTHGRVLWTIKGKDYTKQFYPPNLRDLEFTPQSLIAEMDYAGVDVALLHTDPMLGRDSQFLERCVQLYPERLRSMAPVDEWRIASEVDAVIDELAAAINVNHLHAIKFNAPLAYLGSQDPWDDGLYRPFWEAAVSLNVPVFFTLGSGPPQEAAKVSAAQQRSGYLGELRVLVRWIERYPDTVCSLTHGFPWRAFLDGDRITLPKAIWDPFRNPKLYLEVSFPVRLGDVFEYPYREVWPTLEQMTKRIGADHLLWGTDMPFQNRFCTYRQSRDWIEKHCGFLGAKELHQVMGGTAARLLGLG